MKKVTELLPFALFPNPKIEHFQAFIKDIEVERLIAASNASGKPHCDFAFPPLLVGNAKCLLGKPQTPNKAQDRTCGYVPRVCCLEFVDVHNSAKTNTGFIIRGAK